MSLQNAKPKRAMCVVPVLLALSIVSSTFKGSPVSAQTCSPSNPPVIHVGDQVTVIATLSTSDNNEVSEHGEYLKVTSSGGFEIQITRRELPQASSFTATLEGETLLGTLVGYDEDESCTLIVTAHKKQRLSKELVRALNNLSANLNFTATGTGIVGTLCLAFADPRVSKLCSFVAYGISGLLFLGSSRLNQLALDPADSNFMVIAIPIIPSLPPLTSESGATAQVVKTFNAFADNEENIIGLASAILTCFNRAQGAADANDSFWEAKQIEAAQQYEMQLGILLDMDISLRTNLEDALRASAIPQITPSRQDILKFKMDITSHGSLPSDINTILLALGASLDEVAQITRIAKVQDPLDVEEEFPKSLINDMLLVELKANSRGFLISPCVTSATSICLDSGRFAVSATFSTGTQSGIAHAVQLTSDTGYLWFFSPSNAEAVVKVINGCSLSRTFWVFAGGLTDVNTIITVIDTKTGLLRTYTNPPNTPFQPIQDTSAFQGCSLNDASALGSIGPSLDIREAEAPKISWQERLSILSSPPSLLLNNSRFKINVNWKIVTGQSGIGTPVQLTSDSGYFWFFGSSNIELLVKVLNGCPLGGRYWVFAGGLTDVNTIMTITDTKTGIVKTYINPPNTPFQPIQDTSAFATCP